MSIEQEIFKKSNVNYQKLKEFGFTYENNVYSYTKNFLNDDFQAVITIDEQGNISGKVYDLQMNDEYLGIRVEKNVGEFVAKVKDEYSKILIDIRENCFTKNSFMYSQSNRVAKYIKDKYNVTPEFLWEKYPGTGVFRNQSNEKWFGIIMDIDKSKITDNEGIVEVIDLHADEKTIESLLKKKGYYPGYHMNKKSWFTIILDDTIRDEEIFKLIDESYTSVSTPTSWLIPANPGVYDVIGHFEKEETINWHQTSKIEKGDTVYIYMGAPISSITHKCTAIEVNLPIKYENWDKAMLLKLEKTYKQDEISYTLLNSLGIKSIRGPRKISKEVEKKLK